MVIRASWSAGTVQRQPGPPTEAGARLLEHAGPILLRLDAARLPDVGLLTTVLVAEEQLVIARGGSRSRPDGGQQQVVDAASS